MFRIKSSGHRCLFVASLGLVFYFFPFPDRFFWSMEEKKKSVHNCSPSYIHFCSVSWLKLANKPILRNGNLKLLSHLEVRILWKSLKYAALFRYDDDSTYRRQPKAKKPLFYSILEKKSVHWRILYEILTCNLETYLSHCLASHIQSHWWTSRGQIRSPGIIRVFII